VSTPWVKILFWLYLLFLVGAEATVTPPGNPADPDLWHRLALGEALWKTGQFPAGDAFSYLADYPSIADHEWGSAVLFYALYLWGGANIFVAIKLITLAVTLALLVWAGIGVQNRRPTALLVAFYALVLLALLPNFASTVRCMTFTHIFFALWLYWFQCERHGRPISTGWYVVTMIIWANLHGGFALGLMWLLALILTGIWLARTTPTFGMAQTKRGRHWTLARAEEDAFSPKKWAVRLGLCSLATLVNPFGAQLWLSTGRALITTRRGFAEWAPVSWGHDLPSYPGYKLLLIGLVVALAIKIQRKGWNRIDRPGVILIGLFAVLSLTSARHTSLFALVAGALAPDIFPPTPRVDIYAYPIRRLGGMAISAAALLTPFFLALIAVPSDSFTLQYKPDSCPVAAVDFLRERNIRGKLLVPFNYGSYALWELRGRMRVSMDGRYDLVYRPETYQRVDDFFQAKGDWPSLLTTPAPDAILVPAADAVYPKLQAEPGWTEAWHEGPDAVFLPR
jgi:hypothetical protein